MTDHNNFLPISSHFMDLATTNSTVKNDSSVNNPPPIGGKLSLFIDHWELTTTDNWVLSTIRRGILLEFLSSPQNHFMQCPVSNSCVKQSLMESPMQHLLDIRAIEVVP